MAGQEAKAPPMQLPGGHRATGHLPMAALVAANAVPLLGVLFLGWDAVFLITLYWLENVIVGVHNIARMWANAILDEEEGTGSRFAALPMSIFFAIHYGIFCAVHGAFVIIAIPGLISSMTNTHLPRPSLTGLAFPAAALFVSHSISFAVNFIGRKEYLRKKTAELMVAPYPRVVVLHLVILFGAFGVVALGSGMVPVTLLVVLKTGVDVAAHRREHRHTRDSLLGSGDRSRENQFGRG